jgi:para-nitrobenzyl esterase
MHTRMLALSVLLAVGCSEAPTVMTDAASPADAAPSDAGPGDAGPVTIMASTEDGPVVGVDRGGALVFRGIPYAAPPLGALRFAPPADPAPWATPLDATVGGASCIQPAGLTGGAIQGTEDCLQLNVTTPALEGSRPVMVWIHGGGFVTGTGSAPLYDSTLLAEEGDVVLVTINYRLGALGFLSHPDLAGDGEVTGNWGFLDQQAALRWVAANASHFGGDPARVTIFGESAGGQSVLFHTVAPGSAGLFIRAIDESGPVARFTPRADADAIGAIASTSLGCADTGPGTVAACLRAADAAAVASAVSFPTLPGGPVYQEHAFFYFPTLDGATFVEPLMDSLRAGRVADATMILGTNTDEGSVFHASLLGTPVTTMVEYREALDRVANLASLSPTQVDAIVAEYPIADYPTPNDALEAVTTDGLFTCNVRYATRLYAAAGLTTHAYRFDQEPAGVALPGLGVFHSAELVFLFGTSAPLLGNPSSAPELASDMRGYWTRFATSGDPAGTPAWPAWTVTDDRRLHLAVPIDVEAGDTTGNCAFWDAIYDAI